MLKKILCCVLCFACLTVCSCETGNKKAGLHQAVVLDNISVEVSDFFGDSENTYIVLKLLLSEHDSVYDGQLSNVTLNTKMQGGYSYYCVARNESKHTQTYLIHVNAPSKGKLDLTIKNYRSVINPMNRIVEGEWQFSIDSKRIKPLKETIVIENEPIDQIQLFDNAIIIHPSESINFEEFRSYQVSAFNSFEEEVFPEVNSISENNCYFDFVFLKFEKQEELKKITINNIDYFFDG